VDALEQVEVAQDEGALGHDAEAHVAMLGDQLQEAARDAGLRFAGLVGSVAVPSAMRSPFFTARASRRAVSGSAPVLTYTREWNAPAS
jgi:hypothetical protein